MNASMGYTKSMQIHTTWHKLESDLKKLAPEVLTELQTGPPSADKSQWDKLTNLVGMELPSDLSFYFQTVPVGAEDYPILMFPDGLNNNVAFGPLSLQQAISEWEIYSGLLDEGYFDDNVADSHERVKPNWWNKGWIPIAWQGNGDLLCFDLDPDEAGQVGQILALFHDEDSRPIVASSLADLFNSISLRLKGKRWVYDEQEEGLVDGS